MQDKDAHAQVLGHLQTAAGILDCLKRRFEAGELVEAHRAEGHHSLEAHLAILETSITLARYRLAAAQGRAELEPGCDELEARAVELWERYKPEGASQRRRGVEGLNPNGR